MTEWGWKESRRARSRNVFQGSLAVLSSAAPWATVGFLFAMMVMIGGTFTSGAGALFAMPETEVSDVDNTMAVSLLVPTEKGTLVFFDDTRYLMEDAGQMERFRVSLEKRARSLQDANPTLLAMADWRVMGRDLMKFAEIAKKGGVSRILFAEKKGNGGLE